MSKNDYFLLTGEADRLRLAILNKLYNPASQAFLKKVGLKAGMRVLEFGCGTGQMSCWLAENVGPKGKLTAIDSSEAQLKIAHENAKARNISNIEFEVCSVDELANLKKQFDFAYGRWVLIFSKDPKKSLQSLYDCMAPGGILNYETLSTEENGHFSYPHEPLVDRWHQLVNNNFKLMGFDTNLANKLFHLFQQLNCKNIQVAAQQPVSASPEEKMLYRLGIATVREATLKNAKMTDAEFDAFLAELNAMESRDGIIGFFRNILVSGVK